MIHVYWHTNLFQTLLKFIHTFQLPPHLDALHNDLYSGSDSGSGSGNEKVPKPNFVVFVHSFVNLTTCVWPFKNEIVIWEEHGVCVCVYVCVYNTNSFQQPIPPAGTSPHAVVTIQDSDEEGALGSDEDQKKVRRQLCNDYITEFFESTQSEQNPAQIFILCPLPIPALSLPNFPQAPKGEQNPAQIFILCPLPIPALSLPNFPQAPKGEQNPAQIFILCPLPIPALSLPNFPKAPKTLLKFLFCARFRYLLCLCRIFRKHPKRTKPCSNFYFVPASDTCFVFAEFSESTQNPAQIFILCPLPIPALSEFSESTLSERNPAHYFLPIPVSTFQPCTLSADSVDKEIEALPIIPPEKSNSVDVAPNVCICGFCRMLHFISMYVYFFNNSLNDKKKLKLFLQVSIPQDDYENMQAMLAEFQRKDRLRASMGEVTSTTGDRMGQHSRVLVGLIREVPLPVSAGSKIQRSDGLPFVSGVLGALHPGAVMDSGKIVIPTGQFQILVPF